MKIRLAQIMPSRPCKYCLALHDDSIFADFDIDDEFRLYLVRISFDGFGCCYPSWDEQPVILTSFDSKKLLEILNSKNIDSEASIKILKSYFYNCKNA